MNSAGTETGADRSFSTETCTGSPKETLDLIDVWVSEPQTSEACRMIRAGPNVRIQAAGICVFRAGETVELRNGFSVYPNASFTVEILQPSGCGTP